MITEDKVIEIFCIMDRFCKNFGLICKWEDKNRVIFSNMQKGGYI